LNAIGEVCGCSYEWIRQIEERALKKLRLELRHSIGVLSEREFTRDRILTALDAADLPEQHLKL
jgi:hypothetical protein